MFDPLTPRARRILSGTAWVTAAIVLFPWAHRALVRDETDITLMYLLAMLLIGWRILRSPDPG